MTAEAPDFRRNNFDLIRILAATQVLTFHTLARLHVDVSHWVMWFTHFPGVPVFFVSSGFLVSASYERQQGKLGQYFRNRAFRIFPGLWVCLLLTLITVLSFGFRMHRPTDFAWFPTQLVGLIYTPGFLKTFGSGTYNGSLWTIPVELQFYFALPAAYFLSRKSNHPKRAMVLLFALFTLIAIICTHYVPSLMDPTGEEQRWAKLLRYSFVPRIYLFLFGVLLQQFRMYEHAWLRGKALPWLLVYVGVVWLTPHNTVSDAVEMLLLGTLTVAFAYTRIPWPEHLLNNRDISYGVYIYHGLVINVLVQLGITGHLYLLLVVLLAAFVLGACSWTLVERPVLSRKKKKKTAELAAA